MTQIMSQPGFGLPTPPSRHDVISALLNDYGSSFEYGEVSPRPYSPGFEELPLPLPEKDGSPVSLMNMKFPLRVDEPQSPASDNGERKDSLDSSPPTKIVYRSLSRNSKPHSLKLTVSNGSTAIVPPTPPTFTSSTILPSSTASKPLPDPVPEPQPVKERPLPPPPPAKSQKRQQATMGADQSKNLRDRKDSVESQDVAVNQRQSETSQSSYSVKRKAVPELVKKFKSLADLGVGPRGGKSAPLPPVPSPKNNSNESVATVIPASVAQERALESSSSRSRSLEEIPRKPLPATRPTASSIETSSRLPPTPDEQQSDLSPPAPPKKALTMGLPSGSQVPGQETPVSAEHSRGRGSIGYDLINSEAATKSTSSMSPTKLTTITPDPKPSPKQTTSVQAQGSISPDDERQMAPVSSESLDGSRRPHSYEVVAEQTQPQDQQSPNPQSAQSAKPTSPESPPATITAFPPRSASRQAPQPLPQQPNPPPQGRQQQQQPQTSRILSPSNPDSPHPTPRVVRRNPNTAPPITDTHLNCYTHHTNHVSSKNEHIPMECMVCRENSRDRRWACTWCYLRICLKCSNELVQIPGRNLNVLIERRDRSQGA